MWSLPEFTGGKEATMADVKQIIRELEMAIWRYDKITDTLLYLTTVDERQSTLFDTLVLIKDSIDILNDERLSSLYQRLVESKHVAIPKYGQVLKTDHGAFMLRLVDLVDEAAIEINESDIALKAALGLDASKGIWGPKGWHPPTASQS